MAPLSTIQDEEFNILPVALKTLMKPIIDEEKAIPGNAVIVPVEVDG